MSESDSLVLHELMLALSKGTEFYLAAINTTQSAEHKRIFQRMYTARTAVQSYLLSYLNLSGNSPEPVHAFGSFLHKIYPEILSGLDKNIDAKLIEPLKHVEYETLMSLQHALDCMQSSLLKSVILDIHPKLTCRKSEFNLYDKAS